MRFLNGNHIYEFKVAQHDGDNGGDTTVDEFVINFCFRKLIPRSTGIDFRRTLNFPRREVISPEILTDLVSDWGDDVPEQIRSDLSDHVRFNLERFDRMNYRRRGVIVVGVSLMVRVISSARAAVIESNMTEGRRERVVRRRVMDVVAAMPAKKEGVDGLERMVVVDDVEERECAICLERFEKGVEVIKMPCLHVYHGDCILRWLDKNHFCPFCRFKLPSLVSPIRLYE